MKEKKNVVLQKMDLSNVRTVNELKNANGKQLPNVLTIDRTHHFLYSNTENCV